MAETPLHLLKGDRLNSGVDYRDALPVNVHAVLKPILGVEGYMVSHSGLGRFGDAPGRDRGAVYNERLGKHFRVSGNRFVSVNFTGLSDPFSIPTGETIDLGQISGEGNPRYSQASLPYSFRTQAIITDERMWLYDGTTLTAIGDPDLGRPIDGIWLNNYYFLTDGESLYHTDIANEYAIEPDDFATSEFSPDPTVGLMKTSDNQAMVLNRYTTEYFYADPAIQTGFAFVRVPSKAIMAGIIGTHLKCELDGAVFGVGSHKEESPTVLVFTPGQATNVSTREIDKILALYTEEELANGGTMEARTEDRDQLIYIRLPNHTLLYNHAAAKKFGVEFAWSILKSDIDGDSPWVGVNGVYDVAGNGWVYGDRTEGRLGVLNTGSSAQYGEQVEHILYTPFLRIKFQSINKIECDIIPGYTLGDDVSVFVSMTYDGLNYGREWSLKYTSVAEWGKRFIARRLGYVRHWFGLKLRSVTVYRLAFANLRVDHD